MVIEGERDFKSAWLTIERLSILLGMLAMAFVAGANWHRIDGLDKGVAEVVSAAEKYAAQAEKDYVRKDVVQEQLNNINSQLADLRAQLTAMSRKER